MSNWRASAGCLITFTLTMKNLLSSILLFLITVSAFAAPDTARVLFIGNSYTGVNNLPDIIAQVAVDRGDVLIKTDASVGGATFQNHAANPAIRSLIGQKGWDYVVLQEQSQFPAFPDDQVAQDCYPYARTLDSLVHLANPCAKTVFYMTWGRKNGDASNCASFPLICTYNGMDSLLRTRYSIMAQTNRAILSPVGVAWHKMRDLYPATELYQADESHPTEAGSYLAACTLYSVLFKKNPAAITYDYVLSAVAAANIRQVVKAQVWDSLAKWYQYIPVSVQPVAGFGHSLTGHTAQFSNTSLHANTYQWTFGDGTGDTAAAPRHIYAADGLYTVRLIVSNCNGMRDTLLRQIRIGITGVSYNSYMAACSVYPNPASDRITVVCSEVPGSVALYDVQGRICRSILQPADKRIVFEIKGLSAGPYFLRVLHRDGANTVQTITVRD